MADLFNLLEELDRPQLHEEHTNDDDEIIGLGHDEEDQDNDTENLIPASVPPILNEGIPEVSPNNHSLKRPDRLDLEDALLMDPTSGGRQPEASLQQLAYQQLQSWWMQEVHAPEILPFQVDLMDTWIQHLNDTEDADDEREDRHSHTTTSQVALEAILEGIRRVDRQRVKFMVANLLSTRLQKLQKYHLYYADKLELLSSAEQAFVQEYSLLWKQHMETTTTSHFPQTVWKTLDDAHMIPSPNLDQFCWVRVIAEQGVTLSQSLTQMDDDEQEDLELHSKGDKLILPYRAAKPLIEQGQMQLFC